MNLPKEIFKAYDIRGIVETALTPRVVELIGKSIGASAMDQGVDTIVVGWDGRLTGAELASALSVGILSAGCDVIKVGQVPTPALYYAAVNLSSGSGVMVTGSHNPPEYNGLKMMLAGTTLSGDAIQNLRRRIESGDLVSAGAGKSGAGGALSEKHILDDYCAAIVRDVSVKKPLKVVVDCGNGVAGGCAPAVYRALGCEVVELFCEVDGHFPNHHPDPSQLDNLQDLMRAVATHDADFGMAFDGDGDRLGVVTREGNVVWPDRQMILFAQAVLADNPGAEIIFDVKCSQLLPKAITAFGGKATMWKTGHSFIKAKLKQTGAALAGEMSGHIFFNDRWGGFDDGIYAGARLCELIGRQDLSPSQLFNTIPDTVNTPELRLEMSEGEHYSLVEELVRAAEFPDATVNTIDGIRADFDYGFGLLRASNTTPTIIIRFEADTEENLRQIQARFRELFASVKADIELPF